MRVAVVGATGAVGTVMREQLRKRDFPADEVVLFASERSAGKVVDGLTVQPLRDDTVTGFDVAGPPSSPTVSIALVADGDGGREPLTYRLRLAGRDGRWEVAELFPTQPPIPQGEPS